MTTSNRHDTAAEGTGAPTGVRSAGGRVVWPPGTGASTPHGAGLRLQTTAVLDGVLLVLLKGEIDASNSGWLSGRLTAAITDGTGEPEVVVDLTEVRFCDASGIAVLMTALKLCRTRQGALELAGAHGRVARVLSLTGVDRVLALHTELDGALRAIARR
ncbi:hypothetical protein GCM10010182_35090 [Actinomadura cremea]|nr:hypothetical protein GCM10010182_35090 [Actinomadura cremea]